MAKVTIQYSYEQVYTSVANKTITVNIIAGSDGGVAGITKHSELLLDDGTNPHGTTKADVGLSNTDNTSDADKPISTATQIALDSKADKSSQIIVHKLPNFNKTGVDTNYYYSREGFIASYLSVTESTYNAGLTGITPQSVINKDGRKLKSIHWYGSHTPSRGSALDIVIVAFNDTSFTELATVSDFSGAVKDNINEYVVNSSIILNKGDAISAFLRVPRTGLSVILNSPVIFYEFE